MNANGLIGFAVGFVIVALIGSIGIKILSGLQEESDIPATNETLQNGKNALHVFSQIPLDIISIAVLAFGILLPGFICLARSGKLASGSI